MVNKDLNTQSILRYCFKNNFKKITFNKNIYDELFNIEEVEKYYNNQSEYKCNIFNKKYNLQDIAFCDEFTKYHIKITVSTNIKGIEFE